MKRNTTVEGTLPTMRGAYGQRSPPRWEAPTSQPARSEWAIRGFSPSPTRRDPSPAAPSLPRDTAAAPFILLAAGPVGTDRRSLELDEQTLFMQPQTLKADEPSRRYHRVSALY